jgi:hypothetical protein
MPDKEHIGKMTMEDMTDVDLDLELGDSSSVLVYIKGGRAMTDGKESATSSRSTSDRQKETEAGSSQEYSTYE